MPTPRAHQQWRKFQEVRLTSTGVLRDVVVSPPSHTRVPCAKRVCTVVLSDKWSNLNTALLLRNLKDRAGSRSTGGESPRAVACFCGRLWPNSQYSPFELQEHGCVEGRQDPPIFSWVFKTGSRAMSTVRCKHFLLTMRRQIRYEMRAGS